MATLGDNSPTVTGKVIDSHTGRINIEYVTHSWVIDDIQEKIESFDRGQFIETSSFSNGNIKWILRLIPNAKKSGSKKMVIALFCKTESELIQKKVSWNIGKDIAGDFKLKMKDQSFVNSNVKKCLKIPHSYVESNPDAFPGGKLEMKLIIEARDMRQLTTVTKAGISIEPIKNSTEQLSNHLKTLFESKVLTDFKIICEGEVIECHKAILAARSDVFKAMIESSMTEALDNKVEINDFGTETVKAVVKFMYTGTVDDIKANTENLLRASDKYNLEGLKEICVASLRTDVKLENALDMLVLGDMYHAEKLKDTAKRMIVENPFKIVNQVDWKERLGRFKDLIFEVFECLAKSR